LISDLRAFGTAGLNVLNWFPEAIFEQQGKKSGHRGVALAIKQLRPDLHWISYLEDGLHQTLSVLRLLVILGTVPGRSAFVAPSQFSFLSPKEAAPRLPSCGAEAQHTSYGEWKQDCADAQKR
jgi:hypothetical protein